MPLNFEEQAEPSTPASGQTAIYRNSGDGELHAKKDDGSDAVLGGGSPGAQPQNLLLNADFGVARRQDPTVATHYDEHSDRVYGPDRWAITNATTDVLFNVEDRATSPEAGLVARSFGLFEKGSADGKYVVSQTVESYQSIAHRGRTMTFQMDAVNSVNTHTLRMAVLSNGGGQTPDQVASGFVSAFNGASVDPTWGSLITQLTPVSCNANCSIVGDGLTCVLGSNWLRFSGQWVIPDDTVNIIVVVFMDNAAATNGSIGLSDMGLCDGAQECEYTPLSAGLETVALERYYWNSFRPQDPPVSNAGVHTNGALHYINNLTGIVAGDTPTFNYPVPMRYRAPEGVLYNPHGSGAHVRNTTQNSDSSSETIHRDSTHTFYITLTGAFNWLPGDDIWFHIAFSAEI